MKVTDKSSQREQLAVRKDMDINEHEKLSNFAQIKSKSKGTTLLLLFYMYMY
jgi:hypothetical protein